MGPVSGEARGASIGTGSSQAASSVAKGEYCGMEARNRGGNDDGAGSLGGC